MFERLPHVGGRTYTLHDQGPRKDLQVDLGATVFCDRLPNMQDNHSFCNGMETPLARPALFAARSVRRALLTSLVNPGSRYRRR